MGHRDTFPHPFPQEKTSMKTQSAQNSALLWAGYALLLLFMFSLHVQALFSLGLVALILGYVTRNRFRKHEWSLGVAHASWQINTVWLSLLLGVLVIIVLIAICGWMGSDPMLETKLDAITNSDLAPQEMLRALWAIPGTKAIVGTIITFTLLCLIWPLKRILQGLLALRSGIEPVEGQGWLALALAVAIQLLLMLLCVLL